MTFLPRSPGFQKAKLHNDKHTHRMAAATIICSLTKEMQKSSNKEIVSIWCQCLRGTVTVAGTENLNQH
jgi:hypothetical protein